MAQQVIQEQMLHDASSENCDWYNLFDYKERLYTTNGVRILALLCAAFTLYFCAFQKEKYLKVMPKKQYSICLKYSYQNFNYFFVAVHIRNLLVLLSFEGYFQWIVENIITTNFCNLFGFVETFLSVFEVEMLTHLCIERYVAAKYISKGWPLHPEHYYMYVYLTMFFAALYSVVPLLGLGGYAPGFTCGACAYDLILPQNWLNFFVLVIWALRSLKPAFFMIMMLFWACQLENKYDSTMMKYADKNLTKVIIVMTALNLTCWMPLASIKAGILVSQFLYDVVLTPPTYYLRWALWMHAAAPMLNMVGRLLLDYLAQHKVYFQIEQNSDKVDNETGRNLPKNRKCNE